jgi:transcriptional regulator with XRE-family HTH domain
MHIAVIEMELNEKIKLLRKERGLTQKQLAEGAVVDQSTISYWEKGRQEPTAKQRKNLCNALGITQQELFKDVG